MMRLMNGGVLCALCLALLGLPMDAAAQTAAVAAVTPADSSVGVGQTIDLAVEVRDVQALYGMDITVTYDPALVDVVDADPALPGEQVAMGLFLEAGMAVINQADNAAGRIHFVMTQLNPAEPKSGSGNLLVIRFRGKQEGETQVKLADVQLATRDGEAITVTTRDGRLRVVQSVSGPTATPIPAQIPGNLQTLPTLEDAAPTVVAPTGETTPAATAAILTAETQSVQRAGPNWGLLAMLGVVVIGLAALYLRTRPR